MSDKLKHARVLVLGGSFYLIGDRRIPRANDADKD
jgi:hypothetical protein